MAPTSNQYSCTICPTIHSCTPPFNPYSGTQEQHTSTHSRHVLYGQPYTHVLHHPTCTQEQQTSTRSTQHQSSTHILNIHIDIVLKHSCTSLSTSTQVPNNKPVLRYATTNQHSCTQIQLVIRYSKTS